MNMVTTPEVRAFCELARAFCRWAEGPPSGAPEDVHRALALLPDLYSHAWKLPEVEPEDLESQASLTKKDAAAVYQRFQQMPFQYYSEFFRPIAEPPEEPVTGDLADDLMDIYIDLKNGLRYYDVGRISDAVFEWAFSFGVHWGRHATGALRVLHCWVVDSGEDQRHEI